MNSRGMGSVQFFSFHLKRHEVWKWKKQWQRADCPLYLGYDSTNPLALSLQTCHRSPPHLSFSFISPLSLLLPRSLPPQAFFSPPFLPSLSSESDSAIHASSHLTCSLQGPRSVALHQDICPFQASRDLVSSNTHCSWVFKYLPDKPMLCRLGVVFWQLSNMSGSYHCRFLRKDQCWSMLCLPTFYPKSALLNASWCYLIITEQYEIWGQESQPLWVLHKSCCSDKHKVCTCNKAWGMQKNGPGLTRKYGGAEGQMGEPDGGVEMRRKDGTIRSEKTGPVSSAGI